MENCQLEVRLTDLDKLAVVFDHNYVGIAQGLSPISLNFINFSGLFPIFLYDDY